MHNLTIENNIMITAMTTTEHIKFQEQASHSYVALFTLVVVQMYRGRGRIEFEKEL